MNKLKYLLGLFVLLGIIILQRCKSKTADPLPSPSISVYIKGDSSSADFLPGTDTVITIDVVASAAIVNATGSIQQGNLLIPITDQGLPKTSDFNPGTEFHLSYKYHVKNELPTFFTFIITDINVKVSSGEATINPPLKQYVSQYIYNIFDSVGTIELPAYNLRTAQAVRDTSSSADIISSEPASNVTPFTGRFSTKNGTVLVKSTPGAFFNATQYSLKTAYAAADSVELTEVIPSVNDVYIAKITRAGKVSYSIFKITSIFDDSIKDVYRRNKNNDYILFSVKPQR